jgi:opacity protein-like surface antigen
LKKLFYPKAKRAILLLALFCGLLNVQAQEKSFMKLEAEVGPILFSGSENLSFFFNVEPQFDFSENTVIGLRIGLAINPQKFEITDPSQFDIDWENDNGLISFVPTFDYYFLKDDFRPYLGVGVGYYLLSDIDVSQTGSNPNQGIIEVGVKNKVGFLFRGGIALNKLRFGLEYNLVPKADIEIPNGHVIGKAESSYLGLSIGYTLGVGK